MQKETHPSDPRGQEARSEYRIVERLRGAALIEVRLITGRRNQIGSKPVFMGIRWSAKRGIFMDRTCLRPIEFGRQALHAYRLAFRHPLTGQPLSFEAPLPADMLELMPLSRLEPRQESFSAPRQSK